MRNIGNHHQCQLDSFWFWKFFIMKNPQWIKMKQGSLHTHTCTVVVVVTSISGKYSDMFFLQSFFIVSQRHPVSIDSQPASQPKYLISLEYYGHQSSSWSRLCRDWVTRGQIYWLANLGYTEKHSKDYMKQKRKGRKYRLALHLSPIFYFNFLQQKKNFLKKSCR